jgi:hypothetical protein
MFRNHVDHLDDVADLEFEKPQTVNNQERHKGLFID